MVWCAVGVIVIAIIAVNGPGGALFRRRGLPHPTGSAALTRGSRSRAGRANPTNSGLFRRVRDLRETTHCTQNAARRTSVQRDNFRDALLHWRRPHASIDHAAGAAAVGMSLRLRAA